MTLTKALIVSILVLFKKIVCFYTLFGQFSSEKAVGNKELIENVVYMVSENIESNGVSDYFRTNGALTCVVSEKALVYKSEFPERFVYRYPLGTL